MRANQRSSTRWWDRKSSIVTPKVQTTRMPVRGVAIEGDTPDRLRRYAGHLQAAARLDRAMVKSAWAGAGDADASS
jgi:GTPase